MRLLVISDTHGLMPRLRKDCDAIIHCGDLLPNRTFGHREIEETFQPYWCRKNIQELADWIGDKPFHYILGNHDYFDPGDLLTTAGIDSRPLECFTESFHGGAIGYSMKKNQSEEEIENEVENSLDIEGFGYVPYFQGAWNREINESEIEMRFQDILKCFPEIIVSHSPIFGLLDSNRYGEPCGSKSIRDCLKIIKRMPKLFLHGHIHEQGGKYGYFGDMLVVNAACNQMMIEIDKGKVQVVK